MTVYFNNQQVDTTMTLLADLLKEKSLYDKPGVAIAVNHEVVRRSDWDNTELRENDKILIITATQGG